MNAQDNGGPAFPSMHSIDGNWSTKPDPDFTGMSLRDWFAGQALAGMVAFSGTAGAAYGPYEIAGRSYEVADAMLAERAKKGGAA